MEGSCLIGLLQAKVKVSLGLFSFLEAYTIFYIPWVGAPFSIFPDGSRKESHGTSLTSFGYYIGPTR